MTKVLILLSLFSVILFSVGRQAVALPYDKHEMIQGIFCVNPDASLVFINAYESVQFQALAATQRGLIPGCGLVAAPYKAEKMIYEKKFLKPETHTVRGFEGTVDGVEEPVRYFCAFAKGESDAFCSLGVES